jgi:uncharacterized membrane protein YphA (DoxX/SURF4 family)
VLPDAFVVAHLLVAAVLLTSGLAKVLRPGDPDAAFEALGVPAALRRPAVVRAHPWVEILLGVAVLVLPYPADVVATVLALGLFTAYLVLVWRAVARGEEASCQCFGSLGADRITPRTVVRNAVLVVVAAVAVADAWGEGSVPRRLGALDADDWWWIAAAAVTGLVAALVVAPSPEPEAEPQPELDYLRLPIPDVPVTHPDGTTESLRDLARGRAQLLFFLSPGCGPCVTVTGRLESYAARLPELDVRVVSGLTREFVAEHAPQWQPYLLLEEKNAVSEVFGVTGRPMAVLLGGDGLLAGGPVRGPDEIASFVDDIEAELQAVRPQLPTEDGVQPAAQPADR